ncbi:MAG TPA: hypothetical protein VJJ75_00300 [Candidatus Nanoarchaeia archaeon]|nr:hypothetical protein [Candidatus Nanoarchaeia archaeon]
MADIKTRVIAEVIGSPEAHVNTVMQSLVEKMGTRKEITITKKEIFKAKKMEKQPLWSTFTEAEISFRDIQALLNFCFDFMPSSVEILSPESLACKQKELSDFVNDLIGRLHQYDMILKNIHAENVVLKRKLGDKA